MSGPALEIDLTGLERRFLDRSMREKQERFARRVAFETRAYVPRDSGHLQSSEALASDYAHGEIVWATPYARRVHDLPQSSIRTTENPRARSRWPEAAKAERMGAWTEFARKLLEER